MMDSIADLMQQATALHERGQLEEAAHFYSRVLAREPEHADALHLTGVVAHQQDRNEDAVALITRAITKNPRAPAFHNNLGLALTALGQTAKAEAAYQEALALVPEFADALLNLGSLRAGQGSFEEAATLLERAVAADSGVPQAHYYLGCARFALADARGALDAFQQAASLGADFAEVHYRIGGAHAAVGESAQAVACYVRALDRDDDHSGALHGLLECLNMLPAGVDAALLETVLAPLLRAKSVNPRTLGHGAARLLERKHALVAEHGSTPSAESLCDELLGRRDRPPLSTAHGQCECATGAVADAMPSPVARGRRPRDHDGAITLGWCRRRGGPVLSERIRLGGYTRGRARRGCPRAAHYRCLLVGGFSRPGDCARLAGICLLSPVVAHRLRGTTESATR